ncbi:unnamed protein product [Knipowitschia caucasica]|uniref:Coiled-coil domain-containing protein 40 n=1 Tax=Knipowitschia caucasica TaxID=637954 RepID=A0AAV2LIE9_KNICA
MENSVEENVLENIWESPELEETGGPPESHAVDPTPSPVPEYHKSASQDEGTWQLETGNDAQENAPPVPVSPDFSDTDDVMQDQRLVDNYDVDEEEEEVFILGPDHELVKRHQTALRVQLSKELERINSALKEKVALEKVVESEMTDFFMDTYRVNENLVRLHCKLEDLHQTKTEAESKHRQRQEQLDINKSQFSNAKTQHKNRNMHMTKLQSEIDSLMHNLTFTQEFSDELHSNIKAMKNATHKAKAEKIQAEEQKLKQDLYVERLTKEMERLTEQVALYNAQTSAQTEETEAAKQALSEAEMEMTSLLMAQKQLLQQWNSSLVGMRRRGESFTVMQEAVRMLEHQLLSLDREIKGYKKTIAKEQEQNEILTMQLNRAQMDNSTTKSQINLKQSQQEAMQARYSSILRTLRETERTLAQVTKETTYLDAEVKDQRRQMERDSAQRLELEDRIVSVMQQQLTHNKATQFSQKLSEKLAALKKEKISRLCQLESQIEAAKLESCDIGQNLKNLMLTQKTFDEEITKMEKERSDQTSKISSSMFTIGQKQSIITKLRKKIDQIAAVTGNEDLSPMQIKADAIKAQIEDLEANKNRDHQLWIKRQGTLVGLNQNLEDTNRNIRLLETEQTCMQQENMRLQSLIEGVNMDESNIDKSVNVLRRDLTRLNTLLSKNAQLSQALEQDNALMKTDFTKKIQEEELESIKLKMNWEKTAEEKERLFNCLIEAERQIMLWEKKIQIVKETYAAVQGVGEQAEIQRMKAEIHRMEVRLTQLMKERERLLRDSEETVARRDTIVLRRESLLHNSANKQTTQGELQRLILSLQRKINTTHKQVKECEKEVRELQESQASVDRHLSQQKQQLIDLCGNSFALDQDFDKLQDTKDKNLSSLVVLQNRSKKLQKVKDNSYKPVSNSESIEASLQTQTQRLATTSSILQRVCQDFPHHQRALRRPTLVLAAHSQERTPERELC